MFYLEDVFSSGQQELNAQLCESLVSRLVRPMILGDWLSGRSGSMFPQVGRLSLSVGRGGRGEGRKYRGGGMEEGKREAGGGHGRRKRRGEQGDWDELLILGRQRRCRSSKAAA